MANHISGLVGYPLQTLTFVNIYFETSTMNEIIYDMRTNYEMKLSTIGGTMGLFTGFSILSAVEILYHLGRLLHKFYERKRIKNVHYKK